MAGLSRSNKRKFYPDWLIDRWIAAEKTAILTQTQISRAMSAESKNTMSGATIKMSFDGFPVELSIADELSITPELIKETIARYKSAGFAAPVSYRANNDDKVGKNGTVVGVSMGEKTKTNLQMYIVKGVLDDTGAEFSWNEFSATAFRKDDKFVVVKNDRGFLIGQIHMPELGGSKDIPF